ncbi:MAG: helix-turn-helix transcriptional regulator [Bacteroidota bacterium]
MKVLDFDIKKGLYHFEVEKLTTTFHAHPVYECVWVEEGHFQLESQHKVYPKLQFAVIPPNLPHKLQAEHSAQLLLIKAFNDKLENFLADRGYLFYQEIFASSKGKDHGKFMAELKSFAWETDLHTTQDARLNTTLQILEKASLGYKEMSQELSAKVFLSESRLSHVFKEHIGISLKKYLLWMKLNHAIAHLLKEQEGLTDAGFQSGFYDQAHFSKAFKEMLGMAPSKAYNSRSLQFYSKNTP